MHNISQKGTENFRKTVTFIKFPKKILNIILKAYINVYVAYGKLL